MLWMDCRLMIVALDNCLTAVGTGRAHLGSVGADGSVRLFDIRNLEHSQIMYESNPSSPLLRLVWNQTHPHLIMTFALDKPGFVVLDIRRPSLVYQKFDDGACVNSVAWMPKSR